MKKNNKERYSRLTNEEFLKRIKNINPNIKILEPFINTRSYIKYECLKCGYINKTIANHLLKGVGCPKCAHNLKLTPTEYIERVRKVNPYIEVVGDYKNMSDKIEYVCLKCGYKGKKVAADLSRGIRMP